MELIPEFKRHLEKIIDALRENLKSIRTGRANPSLIENLLVEAYGGQSKLRLMELSTINVEGPSMLVISPFDPSTIKEIEKAVLKSPLGLSPQVQGSRIIIRLPPLTEEQREKLKKIVQQNVEEKKVNIRNQRDEVRKKIRQLFEAKSLTEDEKFRLEKEIDSITQEYNLKIQEIFKNKEQEIMSI
ncbi:MAG: ribosome recycling factor [Microgenomates group bacterium]|nr:ribosome recycling factor [Microgenomates group bacterium]